MTPALLIQIAVVIVSGLAFYYSTIGELKAQLLKIDEGHHNIVERIKRVEAVTDTCSINGYKTDTQRKDIDDLEKQLRDFDRRLQEHDSETKKLLPLGRRSQLDGFRLDGFRLD